MINITKQQVYRRWDTLPYNLKEALFSEYNADVLWNVCEKQHLSEDKIGKVATLAGDVILGFIHPEDLALEIKSETGINQEIANSIAAEIDRKIFSLIRSDLEKVYAPPVSEAELPAASRSTEARANVAEPPPIPKPVAEKLTITEIRKPEEKISETAPIKIIEEKEVEPLKEAEAPTLSRAEGPVIIHKETEFKPALGATKSLGGLFGFLKKKEKYEEKPVKAEIEMRDEKLDEIKVVNYVEKQPVIKPIELKPLTPTISPGAEIKPAAEIPKTEEKNKSEEMIDLSKL